MPHSSFERDLSHHSTRCQRANFEMCYTSPNNWCLVQFEGLFVLASHGIICNAIAMQQYDLCIYNYLYIYTYYDILYHVNYIVYTIFSHTVDISLVLGTVGER